MRRAMGSTTKTVPSEATSIPRGLLIAANVDAVPSGAMRTIRFPSVSETRTAPPWDDYEPVGRADPDVRPKPALADSKDARVACVIERAVAPCRERPDGRGAPCNDATAQTADRFADGDEDGSGRCAYDRVRTDERWHEHRHPPACRVDAQDSARVVLDDEDIPTRLQFDRRRLCERQRRAGKRDKAEGDKTDHASILGRSEPAKPTDRRRRTRLIDEASLKRSCSRSLRL